MSTPETIYLIPGEYEEGLVWCDDPAPDSYSDPDDAVKYVRADHIPDAGKVITDNSKVNAGLIAENERLQARLAELEGSEMTCIKTLVDIRFACGDDGKRMQGELVEYIAELSRKAVSVPEWIKCSDKMPKINSPVVVARISDNDGKPCLDSGVAALQPNNGWIGLGVFYRPKIDAGTIYQNDFSVMDVTHWMPLPKPPKQEKSQ